MTDPIRDIAIIGAGPAGAHLASLLSAAGRDVILFDAKGAWEKPCGGGVPTRAIREFAFLLEDSNYPRNLVRRLTLISPTERRVTVKLEEPFAIYSRRDLNGLVLDRALEAGAEFIRASVSDFSREGDDWIITTGDGRKFRARFLVGADGAASFTRRRLLGIFPARDIALAFGYNVIADQASNGKDAPAEEEAVVKFPKNFTGYLWAFPRPGVMNFGVASKLGERTSDELRSLLSNFVTDYYGGQMPLPERVSFFGAKIPTLDLSSWPGLRASGERWALIGDAAGFCDPITGEGIYYAFKSADILARVLIDCASEDAADGLVSVTSLYEKLWRESFGHELEKASHRLPMFYHGRFYGHDFSDAVVRLARYHKGVRTVLVRAVMGDQSYITLKTDLLRRAWQVF
ncbi:MAG: NAD(P)/FAD-dependent oxidoreductase [Blastocatellia bacterium]|nr:NAD(P)/FAD-dependent oxidoreductase [Blastocatellia bacterium]